ncbi:30S ribosomal protein S17e [Candidatus Woesearchaeota archaeon]|jgi:small subunit ribosomal protein S17e|nr:30S ribosomal protein S17e [Candidatus Woesearchaeota archaeon]MBT4322178.1 30S ribosomal protein S17e [Candidatus Woesearchaeota archaeon]MBT4631198.1 30S ribosomal protein S17e [Candidatus Woesearchaeota archaeon]
MGKVKTTQIKRASHKILRYHPDKFKKTFEENKKLLPEVAEIRSKKLRNIIAGYITRLVKKEI